MSFSIGNNIKYTIFGESHAHSIGMCIDGLPAGIKIDFDFINASLQRRKPLSKFTTKRIEKDEIIWLSGITKGMTNGGNLCFFIENKNIHSSDYDELKTTPRPSHADYPAMIKYDSFHDGNGGGFFSARLTSALVVAGSIVHRELSKQGITIYSYIDEIGELTFDLEDYQFSSGDTISLALKEKAQQILDDYLNNILKYDAVGGSIKLFCENVPIGIGEPFFDGVESILSHYLFSIPALKSISFGIGEAFKRKKASEIMERLKLDEEGNIGYTTNYNGGILGGLSNGNPIVINLGFRAASSIQAPQETVNLETRENTVIQIKGRHDRAFILRTPVICESVAAMALYDLLLSNQKKIMR